MHINVWLDMLVGRLSTYINTTLEEEVHFDLMTLMRRVFANKTLMNYHLIMERGYDVVDRQDYKDREDFERKIMKGVLAKVAKAFKSLDNKVTVDDMRQSTYVLRDVPAYTFMEAFWILLLKVGYGGAEQVPMEYYRDQLLGPVREQLAKVEVKHPVFMMVASEEPLPKVLQNELPPLEDLVATILQDTEQKLLSVKEKAINGPMSVDHAVSHTTMH